MHFTRSLTTTLVLLLAACRSEPTAPTTRDAQLGDRFTLAVGQTAAIAATPLTVTFARVLSEGRCPANVMCIWEGTAEYVLEVRTAGATADSLRVLKLATHAAGRSAVMGQHRYETVELTPYPLDGTRTDLARYQLTLRVSPAF